MAYRCVLLLSNKNLLSPKWLEFFTGNWTFLYPSKDGQVTVFFEYFYWSINHDNCQICVKNVKNLKAGFCMTAMIPSEMVKILKWHFIINFFFNIFVVWWQLRQLSTDKFVYIHKAPEKSRHSLLCIKQGPNCRQIPFIS